MGLRYLMIAFSLCSLGDGKRELVAKVIERVEAHYDVQDVEFGTVYRWCSETVLVECDCGERTRFTTSDTVCGGCGEDHTAIVLEALGPHPEDEGERHPWRALRPYYAPTRGT
jgi:hypothetical protein